MGCPVKSTRPGLRIARPHLCGWVQTGGWSEHASPCDTWSGMELTGEGEQFPRSRCVVGAEPRTNSAPTSCQLRPSRRQALQCCHRPDFTASFRSYPTTETKSQTPLYSQASREPQRPFFSPCPPTWTDRRIPRPTGASSRLWHPREFGAIPASADAPRWPKPLGLRHLMEPTWICM